MGKSYLFVEGHGEVQAAGNLIVRLSRDLGLPCVWTEPQRAKAMHTHAGMLRLCERLRAAPDCERVLFLRDEDDDCPAQTGPRTAGWLAAAGLSFPAAMVLLRREYEVLFLPCIHMMAGHPLRDARGNERPGLAAGTVFNGDPEGIRNVKGWLSNHFPPGRPYMPTQDQLPLTRLVDFSVLRAAALPCFMTLERALRHIATAPPGAVYPPPPST
jgi:hypothetical protein